MSYKIYVINLKHRTDRKEFFLNHNDILHPIFFEGIVDLKSTPPEFFSKGSYGCALSHFKLWEECINLDEPIIICEDDAILHSSLNVISKNFLNSNKNVDLIHFGCNYDSIVDVELSANHRLISCFSNCVITEKDINDFKISDPSTHFFKLRNSFGMMCYLITPQGAKKLLAIDDIRELKCKSLFIPGLNRSINTYTLDCLLNYYYSQINAFITLPPLAITQNDKTQSDCTSG